MTVGGEHVLLGQFHVRRAAALHTLAGALRRAGAGAGTRRATVEWSQATVVSIDGGSPPTLTIAFDGVANLAGVRYRDGYTPQVADVVDVRIRGGDPVVDGTLAT